jgi:hypothetical protein
MAIDPNLVAVRLESDPLKLPIGVLATPTMHTSANPTLFKTLFCVLISFSADKEEKHKRNRQTQPIFFGFFFFGSTKSRYSAEVKKPNTKVDTSESNWSII